MVFLLVWCWRFKAYLFVVLGLGGFRLRVLRLGFRVWGLELGFFSGVVGSSEAKR